MNRTSRTAGRRPPNRRNMARTETAMSSAQWRTAKAGASKVKRMVSASPSASQARLNPSDKIA